MRCYDNPSTSKASADVVAMSEFVDRYDHEWNGDGVTARCRLCGRQRRETVDGCLIKAAGHRAEASPALRQALGFVRPNHPALDLMSLPFERYQAERWRRNAEAIRLLGLASNREYAEQVRLRWAEQYWRYQAETMKRALIGLHDLFSEIVEDGRVSFQDEAERNKMLEAFTRSNTVLATR